MPIILQIETSINICSVALSENGSCIFCRANDEGLNHARLLSPFVNEALDFLRAQDKKLDAVAVSSGPGSYTGLRIGISTAKGLCYALDIPLIAVSTLAIMSIAASANIHADEDYLLSPMIDARRMEVYTAFFNKKSEMIRDVSADIIDENSYLDLLEKQPVYFFGNGAEKCRQVLNCSNARFLADIAPLAKNMIALAEKAYTENRFEDVAYFEPFYLKEFQVTQPKKNCF